MFDTVGRGLWRLLFWATADTMNGCGEGEHDWAALRRQMVTNQLRPRGIRHEGVLAAMANIPRHEFVPDSVRGLAYEDYPLEIGEDQTISQPFMVAYMTEAADPRPGQRVLEIGTGSGYQAAVLADIVGDVYTIERLPSLAEQAQKLLSRLGYQNIHVRTGDGYLGWPEAAPFDAIVVTCGAEHVPEPLFDQLKPGGRLIIPVGSPGYDQMLRIITKSAEGERQESDAFPVMFVPLLRS